LIIHRIRPEFTTRRKTFCHMEWTNESDDSFFSETSQRQQMGEKHWRATRSADMTLHTADSPLAVTCEQGTGGHIIAFLFLFASPPKFLTADPRANILLPCKGNRKVKSGK
jgi:hypothetical protein